jgi:hypothetical protein
MIQSAPGLVRQHTATGRVNGGRILRQSAGWLDMTKVTGMNNLSKQIVDIS